MALLRRTSRLEIAWSTLTKMSSLRMLVIAVSFITIGMSQEEFPVPHTEVCAGKIDLMFVIDGSHSVTRKNFNIIKRWIKDISRGFSIQHGHVQIGVVQYSYWYNDNRPMRAQKYMRTEIGLGRFKSQRRFDQAVDRIRYQGYKTFTAHAINKTVDYDFQSSNSRYPHARRAIVLVTDGKATDAEYLAASVAHAEDYGGVVMFAVGIGDYSIYELRLITHGHENRIFQLRNFTQLATIVVTLPRELQGVCDCYTTGSASAECDICTRQCECKRNVVGRRCHECASGHYNITSGDGCQPCGCNSFGSLSKDLIIPCNKYTGQCDCKENVQGVKCDVCQPGYSGFPYCRKCECNGFATECDELTGYCLDCRGGRIGPDCETCPAGQYIDGNGTCVPCQCNGNINDNDPYSCDVNTGICLRCLHNTAGKNCENCADFHYRELDGSCTECGCNIHGTDPKGNNRCNVSTGQCMCRVTITGQHCDQCEDGLYDFPDCVPCECNGWADTCHPETGTCNQCRGGRVGRQCQTCLPGQYISVDGSCQKCECNGNINPSDRLSCDVETGKCTKCLFNTVGDHCENCEDFYYRDVLDGSCARCECYTRGSIQANCSSGGICRCDQITAQCPCEKGYSGVQCNKCEDGYWGRWSTKGCQSCNCDLKGSESNFCNKRTGQCRCLLYRTSKKCDECVRGFIMNSDGNCTRENLLDDFQGDEGDKEKPTETTTKLLTASKPQTKTPAPRPQPTPMKKTTSYNCYTGCINSWPSYCLGWLCRRRWPYSPQMYSPRRCHSTHLSCRIQYTTANNRQISHGKKSQSLKSSSRRFPPALSQDAQQHTATQRIRTQPLDRYNLYRWQ